MSHELTFLFITHLSQNCLRHTANDLVECHEHTSVVTNAHLFSSHIYLRTACGTPPTTSRKHICGHELKFLFITHLSQSFVWHIAIDLVFSHELTSLFITHLSQKCMRHTAIDWVVFREHTSVVTETHFFSSHIYSRTACGTPPTTLVFSHENTSVVTNSNFVSSHIHHRTLFGTLPSTWSSVTNSRLSSSHICHRNVCSTPPTTLCCVTNTCFEPRTHAHVTNTHLVSSHICHRTICSTPPTTSRHQSQT